MASEAELNTTDPGRQPVSVEDMYRAWLRQEFNTSAGKRGHWARGRDPIRVPRWFKKRVEKRQELERLRAEHAPAYFDKLQAALRKMREASSPGESTKGKSS